MPELALDIVLAGALVWLGAHVQRSPDPFTAVVLFIVLGLVMALAWVRLAAPDIALAEAAVGAGLTGALLLDAVRQLDGNRVPAQSAVARTPRWAPRAWLLAFPLLLTAAALVWIMADLATLRGDMAAIVAGRLPDAGVTQPVTAVLLSLRAFDTWLETAVLLAAALGVLALRRSHGLNEQGAAPPASDAPILGALARVLVPILVLVGAYLLWLGTRAPGGAFQAGAVIAAAAVLLLLAGHPSITALRPAMLRVFLLSAVTTFALAAAAPLALGDRMLQVPRSVAPFVIMVLETIVTVAVAATLAVVFAGARPDGSTSSEAAPRPPGA